MSKVILLAGPKRSGKDTCAKMIKEQLELHNQSVEIMSFADPLKQIVSIGLGINLTDLDMYKNNSDRYQLCLVDMIGGNHGFTTNCREILQRFGTEAIKPIFGKDVWVNLMKSKIAQSTADFILIPDFRFPVEYINGATTIKVESNKAKSNDTHSSETALSDFKFEYIINNNDYQFNEQNAKSFINSLL